MSSAYQWLYNEGMRFPSNIPRFLSETLVLAF